MRTSEPREASPADAASRPRLRVDEPGPVPSWPMPGIVSYGAYLPYWRLQRSAIGRTLGSGGGKGARAVASYDEDSTSMGVESGRIALAGAPEGYEPGLVAFATTAPAYADKTNATAIHAALGLADDVAAFDAVGAVRSGVGAALMASAGGGLAVLADVRTGRPGSADEAAGGDGAVALAFGDDGVIAEIVGRAAVSAEFIDRWRAPGDSYSQVWEERFGEHVYVPLAEQAVTAALKGTGVALDDVDHVILTGTQRPGRQGGGKCDRCRARRRSSTTSPTWSATPAPPTGRCCWPTCSIAPSRARRSPWSCSPTAATCGSCARPTCCRRTARRCPCATASPPPATTSTYPRS